MNLAMGDEFIPGSSQRSSNLRTVSSVLTNALGDRTVVSAVQGAAITRQGRASLAHQIKQFSLAAYDRLFLFYGANDYLHSSADLGTLNRRLTADLRAIRQHNSWLRIYGILPFPMYDAKGRSLAGQHGPGYYTLHDLVEMLSVVYANDQVPALNWSLLANPVVNQHNAAQRLKGGKYPTESTSRRMADRIAQFVRRADRSHADHRLHLASSAQVQIGFAKPHHHKSASASDIKVKKQ